METANLQPVITVLLFLLNVIGGLVFFQLTTLHKDLREQINDVKNFTRDTRRKLDGHCENFAMHAIK